MSRSWREVVLGDVIDLLTGYPFKSAEYSEAGPDPRVLRGDNVGQGRLRWEGAMRWPQDLVADLDSYWLREGDVILAMDRPWIEAGLKFASVRATDLPCLLVQRVARLRGLAALETLFLHYVIGSREFTNHVLAVQTGTSIPHISPAQIRGFRFALPPIDEQQAIAHVLGALDDKSELNRRMNETLEAMARALFKSWFVDFDPVRAKMAGRTPFGMDAATAGQFSSSLDRIDGVELPATWTFACLGDFFGLQRGTTYESRLLGMPGPVLLGLGTILPGGGFRAEKLKTYGGESPAKMLLKPGDIYVALKGATKDGSMVGSVARLPPTVPVGRLTQDTVKLEFNPVGAIAQRYLHWSMQTPEYRDYCAQRATGSAQVGLSRIDFLSYKLVLPPNGLLGRFAEIEGALGGRIDHNQDESRTLAELRDLLLPKLLSGEVRIREAEKVVEAVL